MPRLQYLAVCLTGLMLIGPARADDDDDDRGRHKKFWERQKEHAKWLRELQKKQDEHVRERQKRHEEWLREDWKRQDEFDRERRKQYQERLRERAEWDRDAYRGYDDWPPYGPRVYPDGDWDARGGRPFSRYDRSPSAPAPPPYRPYDRDDSYGRGTPPYGPPGYRPGPPDRGPEGWLEFRWVVPYDRGGSAYSPADLNRTGPRTYRPGPAAPYWHRYRADDDDDDDDDDD